MPPRAEPTPPTAAGTAAPAHLLHKRHEATRPALAVARPVAAATPAAATALAPAAASPATAPKGAFAEGEALFRGGNVEGALAKYQEAARANPSDAKAQRQIGKCYNRLGQKDRAQPYLKKYLELAPDASDAAFVRAMIEQK